MTEDEQFFYEHAGYSWYTDKETPDEGRRRCAREHAQAERWAKDNGIEFIWENDPDQYSIHRLHDELVNTCESCIAVRTGEYAEDDEILASLGCIDNATPEYRRVIEAELALEAIEIEKYQYEGGAR